MHCFLKIFCCELKINLLFFLVPFFSLIVYFWLFDHTISYLIEWFTLPLLNLIVFKFLHHAFILRWTCWKWTLFWLSQYHPFTSTNIPCILLRINIIVHWNPDLTWKLNRFKSLRHGDNLMSIDTFSDAWSHTWPLDIASSTINRCFPLSFHLKSILTVNLSLNIH